MVIHTRYLRRTTGRESVSVTIVDLPQHLETIAELSAAFTGFAGLVGALGTSHLAPKVRYWRVLLIIVSSLAAMFGALTPSTLQLFLYESDALWRVSSFVLLLFVAGQLTLVYRTMPVENAGGPLRLFYDPISSGLTLASISLQVCLAAIAIGFLLNVASGIYSLALLFLLAASAFHFLRLVIHSNR